MIEKKQKGWQRGQSGNPKGKTPGSGALQKLRASIAADVPDILAGLVVAAKAGDVQAARLILERVLPPIKAIEQAVELQFPDGGTLTAQGRAVLSAVAAGELAPGQGAVLLAAIGSLARVTAIDEIETRLSKLEQQHDEH
ncbi:MAG: DUF5681 domain-containing protein [Rhodoferax sp.]